MSTFLFSFNQTVQVEVHADSEPDARTMLQTKIERLRSDGVLIPQNPYAYDLIAAY